MIAIDTMRANVFRAPEEFEVTEIARPRPQSHTYAGLYSGKKGLCAFSSAMVVSGP